MREQLKDIEVRYLYVKKFKWANLKATEAYGGHPIEGEVYRSAYNKNTKNHRILLPEEVTGMFGDALVFDKLVTTDDELVADMEEISLKNIIQLNLPEEALDKMLGWMESDNKDVKKLFVEFNNGEKVAPELKAISQGLQSLEDEINKHRKDELRRVQEMSSIMAKLYSTNTTMFDIVLEMANHLVDFDMSRQDSISLSLSLGPDGRGININNSLSLIETYMAPVKEGGDRRESVVESIIHQFVELQRRANLQLD